MNYRAVGFDFGGVLTQGQNRNFLRDVAKIANVSEEDLRRVYFQHNHHWNIKGMSYEQAWSLILAELGRPGKLVQVINFIRPSMFPGINRTMISLVDRIRASGMKVGLLSNTSLAGAAHIRQQGLGQHFDCLLFSSEIGQQKPSREAFEILAQQLDVRPSELIYVDDSPKSLELASAIGYFPMLFVGYEDLVQQLQAVSVL